MMLEFIVCHCWVLYCVGMFFFSNTDIKRIFADT